MPFSPIVTPHLSDRTKQGLDKFDADWVPLTEERLKLEQDGWDFDALSPPERVERIEYYAAIPRRKLKLRVATATMRRKFLSFVQSDMIPDIQKKINDLTNDLQQIEYAVRKKAAKAGWLEGHDGEFGVLTTGVIRTHPDYRAQQNKIMNVEAALSFCYDFIRTSLQSLEWEELQITQLSQRLMAV